MRKDVFSEIGITAACLSGSLFFTLGYEIAGFCSFLVANLISLRLFYTKKLYILLASNIVFLLIHVLGICFRL
jgi:hypothetical protein